MSARVDRQTGRQAYRQTDRQAHNDMYPLIATLSKDYIVQDTLGVSVCGWVFLCVSVYFSLCVFVCFCVHLCVSACVFLGVSVRVLISVTITGHIDADPKHSNVICPHPRSDRRGLVQTQGGSTI